MNSSPQQYDHEEMRQARLVCEGREREKRERDGMILDWVWVGKRSV